MSSQIGRQIRPWEITPRQREMLRLAAWGLSTDEIGARLGVVRHSVSKRLSLAFDILQARSRADAWRSLGWLTPPEPDPHAEPSLSSRPGFAALASAEPRLCVPRVGTSDGPA